MLLMLNKTRTKALTTMEMPTTTMRVTLDERTDGGTRMVMVSTFGSLEHMEQLVEMGMEEGITAAVGQIDALLL